MSEAGTRWPNRRRRTLNGELWDLDPFLTTREIEVLRWLPTKLSVAEIADTLGLSLQTVRSHVRALNRKFEVNSRVGVCLEAAQRGYFAHGPCPFCRHEEAATPQPQG